MHVLTGLFCAVCRHHYFCVCGCLNPVSHQHWSTPDCGGKEEEEKSAALVSLLEWIQCTALNTPCNFLFWKCHLTILRFTNLLLINSVHVFFISCLMTVVLENLCYPMLFYTSLHIYTSVLLKDWKEQERWADSHMMHSCVLTHTRTGNKIQLPQGYTHVCTNSHSCMYGQHTHTVNKCTRLFNAFS